MTIYDPFAAKFKGKRGFNAKPGHYMDIGFGFDPEGQKVDQSIEMDKPMINSFEALVFQVDEEGLLKIAKREGYPNGIFKAIKESDNLCNRGQRSIAEYLWELYCKGNSSSLDNLMIEYRTTLEEKLLKKFQIRNIKNYIPHPM